MLQPRGVVTSFNAQESHLVTAWDHILWPQACSHRTHSPPCVTCRRVAAGAPAGVVSAFAEPRRRCAGAVPDVAGAVCASAAPSSWRTGGCAGCYGGRLTVFAAPPPPPSLSKQLYGQALIHCIHVHTATVNRGHVPWDMSTESQARPPTPTSTPSPARVLLASPTDACPSGTPDAAQCEPPQLEPGRGAPQRRDRRQRGVRRLRGHRMGLFAPGLHETPRERNGVRGAAIVGLQELQEVLRRVCEGRALVPQPAEREATRTATRAPPAPPPPCAPSRARHLPWRAPCAWACTCLSGQITRRPTGRFRVQIPQGGITDNARRAWGEVGFGQGLVRGQARRSRPPSLSDTGTEPPGPPVSRPSGQGVRF